MKNDSGDNIESTKKRTILITDDEASVRESLEEILKPFQHSHNIEIVTAADGEAAIAAIDSRAIDLLITDLKMPKVDGFKVISHLISHQPSTPVVVMTAYGSPKTETQLREMEIVYYLEKPIQYNQFVATVLEILSQEQKGKIEGIAVSTLLQLLEMEKTTCTLTVSSPAGSGSLYLKEGELLQAETEKKSGKDAALEILLWDKVDIDIKKTCKIKASMINSPLTEILLESSRLKDEQLREEKVEVKLEEESQAEAEKLEKTPFYRPEDFGLGLDKIEIMVEQRENLAEKGGKGKPQQLGKEWQMDIPKLKIAIETLRESLGGALITTDIFSTEDAQPVAGWNSNPAACAIFTQFTQMINSSLKDTGFPEIGRYYLLDLVDRKIVIVIPMGNFQWAMLIDGTKTQLGLILNLAIPKAIGAFEEALSE